MKEEYRKSFSSIFVFNKYLLSSFIERTLNISYRLNLTHLVNYKMNINEITKPTTFVFTFLNTLMCKIKRIFTSIWVLRVHCIWNRFWITNETTHHHPYNNITVETDADFRYSGTIWSKRRPFASYKLKKLAPSIILYKFTYKLTIKRMPCGSCLTDLQNIIIP